jgi:hypothetical protein
MSPPLPPVLALLACSGGSAVVPDGPADATDAGTDTGGLPDTSTPATGATGATADTGSTATGGFVFDEDHVLVIPDQVGLQLMDRDGNLALSRTWSQLVGSCTLCGGEGASADGDGLLLAFTTNAFDGAVARIRGDGTLDFRVDGFTFPHDAVRDPLDDTIIVPETTANQISWVAGDGSSASMLRRIDRNTPGGDEELPNGLERVDHDGRTYLLTSYRGASFGGSDGRISLWDITTPAPSLVWKFPADGALDTPHCPILREYQGRWWLVWAHTEGGPDGAGTVGLAVADDPTAPPAYVADLVPQEPVAPFEFLRGVELTADGELYLTDSGSVGGVGGGTRGRVLRAAMPSLSPTGATGAVDQDQVLLDLEGGEVLLEGLSNPFEGWLWRPTLPLPPPL